MELARTLRTVRHLRASQVVHRVRLALRRRLWSRAPARVDARYTARAAHAPPLPWDHAGLAHVARLRAEHRDPARARAIAEDALRGRFTLLGDGTSPSAPVSAASKSGSSSSCQRAVKRSSCQAAFAGLVEGSTCAASPTCHCR